MATHLGLCLRISGQGALWAAAPRGRTRPTADLTAAASDLMTDRNRLETQGLADGVGNGGAG